MLPYCLFYSCLLDYFFQIQTSRLLFLSPFPCVFPFLSPSFPLFIYITSLLLFLQLKITFKPLFFLISSSKRIYQKKSGFLWEMANHRGEKSRKNCLFVLTVHSCYSNNKSGPESDSGPTLPHHLQACKHTWKYSLGRVVVVFLQQSSTTVHRGR